MSRIASFLTIFVAMLALAVAADVAAGKTPKSDVGKSGEKSEVQEFIDLICSYYPRECVKSLQDLSGRLRMSCFERHFRFGRRETQPRHDPIWQTQVSLLPSRPFCAGGG